MTNNCTFINNNRLKLKWFIAITLLVWWSARSLKHWWGLYLIFTGLLAEIIDRGETTWNKVDQSWWQVICRFVLWDRWAGGGNSSARRSEPLNQAVPHSLAQPSSLRRKPRMPFQRLRLVNKEKIIVKHFWCENSSMKHFCLLLKKHGREKSSIFQRCELYSR